MVNNITGIHGSMGPVCDTLNTSFSQPHWNTATITPYAAPIERRFMTTALTGTAMERNTVMSRRKDNNTTAPMTSGSRAEYWCDASMPAAVTPPTRAVAPVPATAAGTTSD